MEIGSEFEWNESNYYDEELPWLPKGVDYAFTFSGRTAIETALKNIQKKKKALVPSYCCDSMLIPFRDMDIEYVFYSVKYSNSGFQVELTEDALKRADIFLLTNYFGYKIEFPDELIKKFSDDGGIVIEDITHSLLSTDQYHSYSDYLVASLRKWGDIIDGGYCCCIKNKLIYKPTNIPDEAFIIAKTNAMKMKLQYLQKKDIEKICYLKKFEESNKYLANNYSNTLMSDASIKKLKTWNVSRMITIRRNNALVLHKHFNYVDDFKLLFDVEQMECPLFVPLIISNGKRDIIRKKLIENNIFCPVHWPQPIKRALSNLYETELSLICDQRYNEYDMLKIISVLLET